MLEKKQHYINGAWTASQAAADAEAAIAAAKAAFPAWMATPVENRIALVEKLVDLYDSKAEEMAQAMSLEMGAPIDMSRSQQVGAGTYHLKNFVRAAKKFEFIKHLGPQR